MFRLSQTLELFKMRYRTIGGNRLKSRTMRPLFVLTQPSLLLQLTKISSYLFLYVVAVSFLILNVQ